MSKYAAQHASALAKVKAKGAAMTLSRPAAARLAPAANTTTMPADTAPQTVAGYALRIEGDADRYASLGLKVSESPTVMFVPSTYGDRPRNGMTTQFGGTTGYSVADVNPFAPDGTVIFAYLILQR